MLMKLKQKENKIITLDKKLTTTETLKNRSSIKLYYL